MSCCSAATNKLLNCSFKNAVVLSQLKKMYELVRKRPSEKLKRRVPGSVDRRLGLAVVPSLHPAVTQQPLLLGRAALFLRGRQCGAARDPGQQGAVQAVVERRAQQQDYEAQHLQAVEQLPAQRQAHHPDDQRAQAVQHHAGGGADLLGDADAGEVEEGDADGVPQQSQEDEGPVADLTEGVQRVLQRVSRVVAEVPHVDEIHGDEQQ